VHGATAARDQFSPAGGSIFFGLPATTLLIRSMKAALFVKLSALVALTLATPGVILAQETPKFGRLSQAQFDSVNKKGAEEVSAVKPTKDPLSAADLAFFKEIARGSLINLETSKVAAEKATDPQVKALAKAEVEEQMGLSGKLHEIEKAKGAPEPAAPKSKVLKALAKLPGLPGKDFDEAYIEECAVDGHEDLKDTMEDIREKATDPTLKALAKASLPLINYHLEAANAIDGRL
jgi:putative membrane protein